MAKTKTYFECTTCGHQTPKWLGRCPECSNWNTLEEQSTIAVTKISMENINLGNDILSPININTVDTTDEIRLNTGFFELDRVLGGGIVKGSIILLGGDPGIGKSTLLLQICNNLTNIDSILYVSGEESARQIKLRASRLNVQTKHLSLLINTNVLSIAATVSKLKPDIVMIDSVQTMCLDSINSSPGSVTQVRECTNTFMKLAKTLNIPIIIVGHVNKDGAIAGPKVIEHIVDAVLHFEGERTLNYRILRAVKNRFGSTNEIGVFIMEENGLNEVNNPSAMMLEGREISSSGSCIVAIMEGSRPILTEIQALVTKSGFATPRRTSNGFDYNRMSMLLAILEKRLGFFFGTLDVYINIAGGLKLDETAADLSIILSVISSYKDKAISSDLIAFGEVGLGGEIRAVSNIEARITEAKRLGFSTFIIPKQNSLKLRQEILNSANIIPVENIKQALIAVFQ